MENTFTVNELLEVINLTRTLDDDLEPYTIDQLFNDIVEEELDEITIDDEKITLIQCCGILSNQSSFVRILCMKKLQKESHFTVSDFAKKNGFDLDFGEIIVISKHCQKITEQEKKQIRFVKNKNNKEVKMFDEIVLKKAFKL